ncbi:MULTISPECIES: hypothetical protein [unclassified Kitasatospora]|uniref:hypothetical protein n=1 Tax=unclassified Kitasatospora TaxID=2633591 RepID=UPI002E31842E|nr:hypothetical protein [Kitasatospora sp. NBC_01246]
MPGKNFVLRTTSQEAAAIADAAMGDLARRLAGRLTAVPAAPAVSDTAQALSLLHVLDHLRQATERLQREAAGDAARAGAGYPQIGAACGMTRQGARRRWPGLFHHPTENPRSTR